MIAGRSVRDVDGVGSVGRINSTSAVDRTLEADLGHECHDWPGAGKRVCIATPDIAGPGRNGGIGAAYHHLAHLLAGQGHEVVIAYVNDQAANSSIMEEARAYYARFGVVFEPVVPRPTSEYVLGRDWASTWTVLDWLRARAQPFDIVHVPDWQAVGYGSLVAKALGVAFGTTHFVVLGASPTLWRAEGDRRLVSTEREFGWVFMERRSAELADSFVCTSGHLMEWMRAAGYALPERSFVWPYPIHGPGRTPVPTVERAAGEGPRLEEVVFFGRLEKRKGLALFLDAIDRLVRRNRVPADITFLGGVSKHMDGAALIWSRSRKWPMKVRTITDFGSDEAVAYLRRPGRLAVMPSLRESSPMAVLECLQAGIPFLATAVGGTPELVSPQDHRRALVATDHVDLGERIAELANSPLRAVRPRRGLDRLQEVWSRWHARTEPVETAAAGFEKRAWAADAATPLVTVCIIHRERPELVRMAVDSVFAQDYPALETILIDDGSEDAKALATLDALESEFDERGWRVIRQENRYVGAARNAAVAAARGEWVLFLDDDNVLFPDAVSRLVRAARFAGADCVAGASVPFFGTGDPRTDPGSHDAPIRFLGGARTLNFLHNVAGDSFMLVRRDAFEAVGGFDEEYGLSLEDMGFCNRLMQSGFRIEPLPDPVYYYRIQPNSMIGKMKDRHIAESSRTRLLTPYTERLPAEDRAFAAFAVARISDETKTVVLQQTLAERGEQIASLHHALAERGEQIASLHHALAERDEQIASLHHALAERDEQIASLHHALAERDEQIASLSRAAAERHGKIEEIWASSSWRLTRPLRGLKLVLTGSVGLTQLVSRIRGRKAVSASEVAIPAAAIPRAPLPERDQQYPLVAMLVRDFHDGGLEKVVVDLAKQFLKKEVVCPILVLESTGRAAQMAEELGCSVQAFGGDVAKLVSAVRKSGIKVVITHHCYEPLEQLSMADVKLIEVIHNAYHWQRDLPCLSELRGRYVDRFVAVSDFVRDYALSALSVPAECTQVIENGLSRYGLIRPALRQLTQRRATTVNRPLLVHLANAHPQKNHVAVLRAFESLLADHSGASLVLAGVIDDTTDTGRHIRAEIESRNLSGRVRCVGPLGRRELSRLLGDAHIGLLPSTFEGFSIGALEYAYFGLPTVLSDTGAARRLTDRYGHTVIADAVALPPEQLEFTRIERQALEPDFSTVAGITAAATTILKSYTKFADAARQAGEDWESYSIETVARRYRDLLMEAVS